MNYYLILGINNNATQDEVKSAYRNLAMRYHPDHYGADAEPFRQVQEAYSVLGDPDRRRAYDKALKQNQAKIQFDKMPDSSEPLFRDEGRSKVRERNAAGFSGGYPDNFESLFDSLFDTSYFFYENQRRENIVTELELVLTPDEARRGGRVEIELPVTVNCPDCEKFMLNSFFGCPRCAGKGQFTFDYPLQIEIPAGIKNGLAQKVKIQSTPASDLFILLHYSIEAD